MRHLQTQRTKKKEISKNWHEESAEGKSHRFIISLGMTEIQMDVTACKGKFSSGLKDSPAHTSTCKFPGKEFSSASY